MFKKSPFYRDDNWLGRYCAHPLTAWSHILAGIGMLVLLISKPSMDLRGWGWAFLLVPGVWIFMSAMFFMVWATAKSLGLHESASQLIDNSLSWKNRIFSRECAAFILFCTLMAVGINHNLEIRGSSSFDKTDFTRCVQLLEPTGQAILAEKATEGMARDKFWDICYTAAKSNEAKPATFQELKALHKH